MDNSILIENIKALNKDLEKSQLDNFINENLSNIYKDYEYDTENYVVEENKTGDKP